MATTRMLGGLVGRFLAKGEETSFHVPGALGEDSRILAIDTGDLSDLLFHASLLRAIRDRYPRSRIDVLLPEHHTPLVRESGFARNCIEYTAKQLRTWTPGYVALARGIRKHDYDLCVVMSFEAHPALEAIALASGAPLRLGPSHRSSYPAVNFEVRAPQGDQRYRGTRLAATAPFLGLADGDVRPGWPLPEEKVRKTRQLVHFNKPRKDEILVGVDPSLGKSGAGLSLPNLNFLLNQLQSQMPIRVLPLCAGGATDRLNQFQAALTQAPMNLPAGTMFDTVVMTSLCDLFLAGNTDLFHFAAAQGVPVIGLFVKEDEPTWEPAHYDNVRILRVAEGKRVDVDTLLDAVRSVRGGR